LEDFWTWDEWNGEAVRGCVDRSGIDSACRHLRRGRCCNRNVFTATALWIEASAGAGEGVLVAWKDLGAVGKLVDVVDTKQTHTKICPRVQSVPEILASCGSLCILAIDVFTNEITYRESVESSIGRVAGFKSIVTLKTENASSLC
jgi:hypothetical protein